MSTDLHLWQYDHPYYCSESNYHSNDFSTTYNSWQSFYDAEADGDQDMNFVFRWDWKCDEYFDDDTPEVRQAWADQFGDNDHVFTLQVCYMLQRKGAYRAVHVSVCKADEPAVREFLVRCAKHVRLTWEPLLAGGES